MPERGDAGLIWTGHVLVDVGIAGLCAFAGVEDPGSLTLEQLDRAADYLERTYYGQKELLGPYLSCVFMNASFVQPNEGIEKRQAFISQYLRAHRADPDVRVAGARCVFSGRPATSALVRTHLPLFSGADVLNFRPEGETWVPAAGPFVVAVMFLPLAGRRAEGRMLLVHADDPAMTIDFARTYLEDNRRLMALPLGDERLEVHPEFEREQPMWDAQKKRNKFPDVKGPRSLVVADLSTIAGRAAGSHAQPVPTALTVYLISNSGQGPSLEIVPVPTGVVDFVRKAVTRAATRSAWAQVASGFRPFRQPEGDGEKRRRSKSRAAVPGRAGWSANPAFEDLCAVFDTGFIDRRAAGAWLRRHVLGRIERDTETRYASNRTRSWALAHLFLEEVLCMKSARIDAIRRFADKIAEHISRTNDRKLLWSLTRERDLNRARRTLLAAQRRSAAERLLFGLDEYTTVWLSDDKDEFLVRDLITIRVIERLSESGYFKSNPEDILVPEAAEAEQEG